MDERTLTWAILAAVLAMGMAGGGWLWGWVRGPLIVLCATVALVSGLVTAFFLYAGFAWTSRGGGTLLFFALPAGVLAWVSFALLRVFWNFPTTTEYPP